MAFSGPHRRAPRRIVAVGGLLATLLLAEGLARIQGPTLCSPADGVLLEADPEVGWTFTPNLHLTLADCGGRGWTVPLATNAQGLADQPRPYEKRPGDVRVLLLGNHVADGLGVAREDRLSVRIAHLADQRRGARVSVVNATIPGYATAQELTFLETRGLRYRPDVVVLVLDPERDLAASLRPPIARPSESNVAPASGLLALSGAARWLVGHPGTLPGRPVTISEPAPLSQPGERAQALEKTSRLVERLAAAARAAGAGFAVLVAPPCPAREVDVDVCAALKEIAPCIDPSPTFDGLRRTATKPLELCIDSLGRWGRDGHFLASHALWDLLGRAGVWPAGVVRGHRL